MILTEICRSCYLGSPLMEKVCHLYILLDLALMLDNPATSTGIECGRCAYTWRRTPGISDTCSTIKMLDCSNRATLEDNPKITAGPTCGSARAKGHFLVVLQNPHGHSAAQFLIQWVPFDIQSLTWFRLQFIVGLFISLLLICIFSSFMEHAYI